jgi:hypothetical protein
MKFSIQILTFNCNFFVFNLLSLLIILYLGHSKNSILKDDKKLNHFLSKSNNFTLDVKSLNSTEKNYTYSRLKKKFCDFKKLNEDIKKLHAKNKQDLQNKKDFNDKIINLNESIQNFSNTNNSTSNYSGNFSNQNNESDILNNSVSSDDLLSIIANQTENIKNEICSSCLEINSSLDILLKEIKDLKKKIKFYQNETQIDDEESYLSLVNLINNLNLIKVDLFKFNEILQTIQKAECHNYQESFKKYTSLTNYSMKLVEMIQNILLKLNLDINVVILN